MTKANIPQVSEAHSQSKACALSTLATRKHLIFCLVLPALNIGSTRAHAAAAPWEGQNALDAAFFAYSAVSVLRQQIKPDQRVHGIIEGKIGLRTVRTA